MRKGWDLRGLELGQHTSYLNSDKGFIFFNIRLEIEEILELLKHYHEMDVVVDKFEDLDF
jgi:hypothetical protein